MTRLTENQAVNTLEDYGYSFNFSLRILNDARNAGTWINMTKNVTVTYEVENKMYVIEITNILPPVSVA